MILCGIMEGEFKIDIRARKILEEFHHACLDKKTADRIKAILLLADGFTYQQIERILLLNERTLNRYKKIYNERGIDGLVENNYQGRYCKLNEEQIDILKQELRETLYSTSESICKFVLKTFNIKYSVKGMTQLLRRIGFCYKKTSIIPGNINLKKQRKFIKTYERNFKRLKNTEKVYFVDGSHPTYNNYAGYGWIERGKRFAVKSNSGRERVNLLGAYDPKTGEDVIYDYSTLNQDAAVDFLHKLSILNTGKTLHVIWDNAKYQYAKVVREAATELGIDLIYLPEYSPNLNLIERYWGYLKKKVLVNKYYETFEQFRNSILSFSRSKSKKKKIALQKYIPEKFHILEPAFT
jgi:transposase